MFSSRPTLFPPFASERRIGCATPAQRHMTPKVWHTETSAASSSARIALNRSKSGRSQDASSWMPWLPSLPSLNAGSMCPGPPVPRYSA